jgi:hypothetical protein
MTTRVIICLDGCGPDYLEAAATPNLDALAREGYHAIGEAVVPTVTNVNNTSIITASFPETHGITTNYLLDPVSGGGRGARGGEGDRGGPDPRISSRADSRLGGVISRAREDIKICREDANGVGATRCMLRTTMRNGVYPFILTEACSSFSYWKGRKRD